MYEDFFLQIQYTFRQTDILVEAFTHSSYANEKGLSMQEHNERLEFLGDAVLELMISEILYTRFPHYTEGQLTKFRAGLVCELSLAKLARRISVDRYVRLGKGEEGMGGRHRDALLADVFESVIGAIYRDGGMESARQFIRTQFDTEISRLQDRFELADNKTFLQEALQKNSKEPAVYKIVNEAGPDHDKTFTATVSHDGAVWGEGIGKSKKEAEQNAALAALKKLGLIQE